MLQNKFERLVYFESVKFFADPLRFLSVPKKSTGRLNLSGYFLLLGFVFPFISSFADFSANSG